MNYRDLASKWFIAVSPRWPSVHASELLGDHREKELAQWFRFFYASTSLFASVFGSEAQFHVVRRVGSTELQTLCTGQETSSWVANRHDGHLPRFEPKRRALHTVSSPNRHREAS
jgi:hypothetical protein